MMPDILYLVHRVPFPPDKGERIRSFHLLRFLARRANVHLACLADEPVADSTVATLKRLCRNLTIHPVGRWARWLPALGSLVRGGSISEGAFASRSLRRTVADWAKTTRFHAALASASSLAPYLRLPELAGVPAVLDLMDVDSQKWFDYAAN